VHPSAHPSFRPSYPGAVAFPIGTPAEKKSNAGLIAAVVVVLLLVVAGSGAAAAYFFFFRAPTPLAKYYPENTQVYVEAAGVKRSLLSLSGVRYLDPSKLDDKKALEETKSALANAFEMSPIDAARVALGLGSIGFGGRDLEHKSQSSIAVVISWDDASAAEALLKSPRFELVGDFGKGGKRYALKRRELANDQASKLSSIERTLSELKIDAKNEDDQLVWFPSKKVLVLANAKGAEGARDAIEGGAKSLEQSTIYGEQKARFAKNSGLVGFIDTAVVKDAKPGADVEKYFNDAGAIALTAGFENAGLRMTMSGRLAGLDEHMSGWGDAWIDSPKLALPKRLPKETVAYLGFSSKTNLKGKEARDTFFKGISKEKSTAGLQKTIEGGEKELGLDLTTVFDAVGDEGIIGVAARDGYKYVVNQTPSFDDFAVIYAQKVRDPAAAKRVTEGLKKLVAGGPFKLNASGDDFVLDASNPIPRVEVRHADGMLVVVAGAKPLADRTFSALKGQGALADDAAHAAVTEPLDAKHLLLWTDLGRIGDTVLTATPSLKEGARQAGVNLDAVVLSGDRRLTGAVGFSFTKSGADKASSKLGYTIDSMNLPMFGGLALLAPGDLLGKKHRVGSDKDPEANAVTAGTATVAGVDLVGLPASCVPAFERYDHCVYKNLPSSTKRSVVKGLRDSVFKVPAESRATMCQNLLQAAERAKPGCK
jgi:hypothetical protein